MALAVGMVISELTPAEYYANVNTWKYLLNGIFLLQHDLPGVFTHNIYGNTVNGPLWTLPVEFMCYIMCFAIYKMKLMNKKIFKFTIPIAVLLGIYSGYFAGTFVLTVIRPVLLFYIGIGLYVYRDRVVMSAGTGILSALVFVLLLLLKADVPAMYLCFPYIIYYLAFGLRYKLSGFGKRGEFSYGMYLWGWPAAQVICQMSGGQMSWWLNAILAAVIAVVLGVVNYLVVDRRISRWQKQRIQGK
jgi:peptidoglycan/LPS O-acetylase OafA/YrhL